MMMTGLTAAEEVDPTNQGAEVVEDSSSSSSSSSSVENKTHAERVFHAYLEAVPELLQCDPAGLEGVQAEAAAHLRGSPGVEHAMPAAAETAAPAPAPAFAPAPAPASERRGIRGLFGKRAPAPAPAHGSHNNNNNNALDIAGTSNDSHAPAVAAHSEHGNDRGSSKLQTSTTRATAHRRDSSILGRSVSLRSHRTNPSIGSSFTSLSPRQERHTPTLALARQVSSKGDKDKDTAPAPAPALTRKISLTAKGLSHKFKSTEALPNLNAPALAHINLDAAGASMLVGSAPGHAPPSMNRKLSAAPADRPGVGLHAPSSFSRDISSSHSNHPNGAPLSHAPTASTTSGGGGPLNSNTIYTQIQETSAKRMATIDYMRRLHDGDIFYFSTLHYAPAALSAMPSLHPHKLGRRATNYFILGYSLPALLDMNCSNPLEYLKALSALLVEFETFQNLSGFDSSGNVTRPTGRVGAMLKSGMGLNRGKGGRRSSTAIDPVGNLDPRQADLLGVPTSARNASGDSGSPHDLSSPINPTGHEFTYLLTPHLPFEPDFSTTLGTLCDTLIDTYGKLLDLVNGPDSCTPMVGTEFAKADKAIRKILIANVVREFEDTTRAGIKGEIAGLGKLALGGLM